MRDCCRSTSLYIILCILSIYCSSKDLYNRNPVDLIVDLTISLFWRCKNLKAAEDQRFRISTLVSTPVCNKTRLAKPEISQTRTGIAAREPRERKWRVVHTIVCKIGRQISCPQLDRALIVHSCTHQIRRGSRKRPDRMIPNRKSMIRELDKELTIESIAGILRIA